MGQTSEVPLRVLRTLTMREFGMTYWEWRETPLHVILENFKVIAAENSAKQDIARREETRRRHNSR